VVIPAAAIADLADALRILGRPKEVCTHIFKGIDKTEDPHQHVLKAVDWMTKNRMPPGEWPDEFRHTLAKKARAWYDKIVVPDNWERLREMFCDNYDIDGKRRQWHAKWRSFVYNPDTDDITDFCDSVRSIGGKLGYGQEAIADLIKECMPRDVYGIVCRERNLVDIVEIVERIFSRETPGQAATPAPATPFSRLTLNKATVDKRVTFEDSEIVKDAVKEVLNQLDGKKPYKPPYKPRIWPKSTRGKRPDNSDGNDDSQDRRPYKNDDGQGGRNSRFRSPDRYNRNKDFDRNKFRSRDRDQNRGKGRGNRPFQRYTNPPPKRTSTRSRPMNKDETRCHLCKEFGHWKEDSDEKGRMICPSHPKNHKPKVRFRAPTPVDDKPTTAFQAIAETPDTLYRYMQGTDGETYFEQLN
jgi:hypothetical protein